MKLQVIRVFALIFALSLGSPANTSWATDSGIDESSDHAESYEAAAKACRMGRMSHMIGMGLWGATAAVCGLNCFKYLSTLSTQRNLVVAKSKALQSMLSFHILCPPVAPFVPTSHSQLAVILPAQAESQVELTKGVLSKADALGAMSLSNNSGPDERIATGSKALAVTGHGASVAASGYNVPADVAGTGYCKAAVAPIETATNALTSATATYNATIATVVSRGKMCAFTSIGVAGADLVLTQVLAKDISDGLLGIAGAAPGIVSLMKFYLAKDHATNATPFASTMGISSCFTTGISLALLAIKAVTMKSSADCEQINQENADSLDTSLNEMEDELGNMDTSWLTSSVVYDTLKVAGYLLDPIIPCAVAAGVATQTGTEYARNLTACQASVKTHATLLSCAKGGDSSLRSFLDEQPDRADAVLGALEQDLGVSREEFLTDHPPTIEKIASLMTKDTPSFASDVVGLYRQAEVRASQDPSLNTRRSKSGNSGIANKSGSPQQAAVPTALAPPSAESGQTRKPASTDGFHDASDDLFSVVSTRYQSSQGDLEKLEWSSGHNRDVYNLIPLEMKRKRR